MKAHVNMITNKLIQPKLQSLINQSAWGFINLFGTQFIRLIGNLAMTRLLIPEAFGIMAIANVFIIGLNMISDAGIMPCIIKKKKLNNNFLHTAWTLQIFRGFILAVIVMLISYPISFFYNQEILLYILPIIGLGEFILGFQSVNLIVHIKEMKQKQLAICQLSAASIGVSLMILLCYIYPQTWSLAIGNVIMAVIKVAFSHYYLSGVKYKLMLDKDSLKEFISYGKWIVLGTAFTFLASHGDRLILGKFLSAHELGIYAVAFFFSQAVSGAISSMSIRVIMPAYKAMNSNLKNIRLLFITISIIPIAYFSLLGEETINILYDDRYIDAGWILQILILATAPITLKAIYGPVLLANGDSFRKMILSCIESTLILTCVGLGGYLGGLKGFVVGFVAGQLLSYPACFLLVHRYKVCSFKTDFSYFLASSLFALAGFSFN